ncbi:Histone-lysine N-methyltransferase NSD2, partial [Armadillidium nasatum]
MQASFETFEDELPDKHKTSLKCQNTSLSSLAPEKDSPCKSPTILSFDAYGNLTSSDDPDAYSHEVPSLAEFDYILSSFEGKLPEDGDTKLGKDEKKSHPKKKNGAFKKKISRIRSEVVSSESTTSLSDTELRQAFKKDFDSTSLGLTSRYGRTRKQKSDDGFLFGTLNFNELRKITSTSPKKVRHSSSSDGKSDSEITVADDDSSGKMSHTFETLSANLTNYSSEDEFVSANKNNRSKPKPKIKRKRSLSNKSLGEPAQKRVADHKVKKVQSRASKRNKKEKKLDNSEISKQDISQEQPDKSPKNVTDSGAKSTDDVLHSKKCDSKKKTFINLKSIDDDVNIIKSSLAATKKDSPKKEIKIDSELETVESEPVKSSLMKLNEVSICSQSEEESKINEPEILKMETLADEIKPEDTVITKYGRHIKKTVPLDVSSIKKIKNEILPSEKSEGNAAVLEEEFLDIVNTNDLEIEKEFPCQYFTGDLVWAYLKGNPAWPGMITYPRNESSFTKFKMIIPYKGMDDLISFYEDLKANTKNVSNWKTVEKNFFKLSSKMTSLFSLKSKSVKSLNWYRAVKEADSAFILERYERIQHFKPPEVEKSKNKKNKTIASKSESVHPASRLTNISNSNINVGNNNNNNTKGETNSNKSKSSDDFSGFDEDSSYERRKTKRMKLESKVKRGDFEVYLQKHLESTIQTSNISREKAKKLLQKKWNKLTPVQKLRYKSKVSYNPLSSCDTDDSSSDLSTNSSKSKKNSCEDELHESVRGTYRVARNEKVCIVCESVSKKSGTDMVKCKGLCGSLFHLSCIGLDTQPAGEFKCVECLSGTFKCFICKSSEGSRNKCSVNLCGKFYHDDCLKKWPQVSRCTNSRQVEKFVCPRHVCHMCAANADDMNDPAARTPPFTRCLRCPTTYHTGETCVAAGVEEVSQNYHICTKHIQLAKPTNHHFNVNWCFCCSKGGSLLLCDQCPAAFHAECLNITAPDGGYVCEDCENGKFPVYGDIVWVKLGQYRWWPGEVLHPRYIPDNIENLHHVQGMFCVHFFGSDDYYWLNRGRTFHYQEGDQGSKGTTSKMLEQKFQKALNEAVVAYRKQKEKRELQEQNRSLKGNMIFYECLIFVYCFRMLMVECIKEVCPAKERCNNQRFQKRQYPNVFPFKTQARGWGLKTKDFIKKGSFVIEYVGELIDEAEFRRRIDDMHECKEQNYYFLTVETDRMIDAGPKGNLARFMNHSCQPNCETQKWTVGADTRVGLFALEDIPEDSELTFNYNLECVGTEKKICNCGAQNCSGFIGVKVQKIDATGGLKKLENGLKKKKKVKRKRTEKDSENECFRCGYEGDLILCDVAKCPKGYHLDCLGLKELPKGKWSCPWHHCDECGSRSVNKCVMCPNSYCRFHSNEKFNPLPGFENVCLDHCAEDLEALRGRMKAETNYQQSEDKVRMCQPENTPKIMVVIKDSIPTSREVSLQSQKEKKSLDQINLNLPKSKEKSAVSKSRQIERALKIVVNNNNNNSNAGSKSTKLKIAKRQKENMLSDGKKDPVKNEIPSNDLRNLRSKVKNRDTNL